MRLYDKSGKEISLKSTIKDDMGKYRVELGSFERNDGDEIIAVGINMGVRKLLWPERTQVEFELIEE
mgnify:CR=1 FL=1